MRQNFKHDMEYNGNKLLIRKNKELAPQNRLKYKKNTE